MTTAIPSKKQPVFNIGDSVELKGVGSKWWQGYYILQSRFEEGVWWYAIARPYVGGSAMQKVSQLSLPVAFPEWCLRCLQESDKLTVCGQAYTAANFIGEYGKVVLRWYQAPRANANLLQLLRA